VNSVMHKTRIAIVGLGKIARDQHIPALAAGDAFELVGVASPHNKLDGVPSYDDIESLLDAVPDIAAVSLCTTPQVRYEIARFAVQRDLHVLLEKPPGVTVSEVLALSALASGRGVAMLASWHSRHAPGVEPARLWLAGREIGAVTVHWKEDVRVWHPGQTWIWKAGGLGVFDPGINALSILTRIIPDALRLKQAELRYPRNCATPIAADLLLSDANGAPVRMELDFLHSGPPRWDIEVDTDAGRLSLSKGGGELRLNDTPVPGLSGDEYPALYRHFAALVRGRSIDVDVSPLQLVADAFLCGQRLEVEPFVQ
jgi:D-galactose 1-dehydrogenase